LSLCECKATWSVYISWACRKIDKRVKIALTGVID
jgi:hypothetical protein